MRRVVFLGNDINDKGAIEIAGETYCPADAYDYIKGISDHVLQTKGGDGVVRELLDCINNKKGE